MDIVGYATIKKGAPGMSPVDLALFYEQPLRVLEFGVDGCVLVLDPKSTGLASFDKEHVHRSFRCSFAGEVICPPDLNFFEKMAYMNKCMQRKGGYSPLLRPLVIGASLHRGTFSDHLLWAKQ